MLHIKGCPLERCAPDASECGSSSSLSIRSTPRPSPRLLRPRPSAAAGTCKSQAQQLKSYPTLCYPTLPYANPNASRQKTEEGEFAWGWGPALPWPQPSPATISTGVITNHSPKKNECSGPAQSRICISNASLSEAERVLAEDDTARAHVQVIYP